MKQSCRYRALFDVIDMPWDWPVEVNFHEARAYCEWKGSNCRLITEAEHCLLSSKDVVGDRATIYSWSEHVKGNIGAVHGSPTVRKKLIVIIKGPVRDLNPGPLAPKARIIPLDQQATNI